MALWRTLLVRDRRAPAGFIRPAQPLLFDAIPTGPEWSHELKWDGWRIVARRDGNRVCLWSRNGRNWTETFPAIVSAVKRLPVESIVLDGEAVCLLEDGRPDFGALRSRKACREARLVAFDLLALNGEDLRRIPLSDRRRRLEKLITVGESALWFSSSVEGAVGPALFRHACGMRLEGIVSKRLDSAYRSGPLPTWRKIKCPGYVRP